MSHLTQIAVDYADGSFEWISLDTAFVDNCTEEALRNVLEEKASQAIVGIPYLDEDKPTIGELLLANSNK